MKEKRCSYSAKLTTTFLLCQMLRLKEFQMINLFYLFTVLKHLDADEKIILKWILKIRWEDSDWINVPQGKNRVRLFVNMVIKFRVP
jgi:hypothetical protein